MSIEEIIKILLDTQTSIYIISDICKDPTNKEILKLCAPYMSCPKVITYKNSLGVDMSKEIPKALSNWSCDQIYNLLADPNSILVTKDYLKDTIRDLLKTGEDTTVNLYFNIVEPEHNNEFNPDNNELIPHNGDDSDEEDYENGLPEFDDIYFTKEQIDYIHNNLDTLIGNNYKKIIGDINRHFEEFVNDDINWNPVITKLGSDLFTIVADPIAILVMDTFYDLHRLREANPKYIYQIRTPDEFEKESGYDRFIKTIKGNYILEYKPVPVSRKRLVKKIPSKS